jgi:hypothetical protein
MNRMDEYVPAIEVPAMLATRRCGSAGKTRLWREIPVQLMSRSPGLCPERDLCDHTNVQDEAVRVDGR